MSLADLVAKSVTSPQGIGAIAVVGTAKNVGKTVTMNYLAHELSARGLRIGLVSSGRDGETSDSFTGEPKPSVVPPEGSWVATAEGVLGDSGSFMEIADVSERPGLLGRLVLGRVMEPAPVELVGPGNARELGHLVRRLRTLGADIVLVDGALDRVAAASPKVTDAVILATGAESDVNLTAIAKRIEFLTWLWSRKSPSDPKVRELAVEASLRGRVSFVDRIVSSAGMMIPAGTSSEDAYTFAHALRETQYRTCLGHEDQILSRAKEARFVVIPGAVSEKFVLQASSMVERDDFTIIAPSAVNVFVTEDAGVNIEVIDEMKLLAVTVNPVSYKGTSYDPEDMVDAVALGALRGYGARLPVFDVVAGLEDGRGVAGVAMG